MINTPKKECDCKEIKGVGKAHTTECVFGKTPIEEIVEKLKEKYFKDYPEGFRVDSRTSLSAMEKWLENLLIDLTTHYQEELQHAIKTLDSIDSLPDMIHPTTGEDYKKLHRMIQKRIDAFKRGDKTVVLQDNKQTP